MWFILAGLGVVGALFSQSKVNYYTKLCNMTDAEREAHYRKTGK